MSVLMKALEKAAEDRDKAPAERGERELTLEAMDAGLAAKPAGNTPQARSNAQIAAAAVLGARQPASAGALAWMRAHPLYVFGGLAGWFLLLYAIYVYVQIAHPGWLIRTTPSPPPVAAAPSGTAPRSAIESAPAPMAKPDTAPLVPLPSVFGGTGTPPSASTASAAEKDARSAAPTPVPAPTPPPPAPRATAAPPPAAASAAAPEQRPATPQNRVAVSRGDSAAPRVNPLVSEAYAALQAGQFDTAQRLYTQALKSEPANTDALLGLAALAQRDNRAEDAQRYLMTILETDPRHALAQSGLIALMGNADPQAAESRLKQLLAREPSAPLYFNLGNLYADQGLWPQAQQAYFQAHNLEPANPDYAYNLAVGLEHLGQQKLALGFYRKAQQLASARGSANFDTARMQDRIKQLSARFE